MSQENPEDQFVSNLVDGHEKNAELDEPSDESTVQDLINSVAADAQTQSGEESKEANVQKAVKLVEDDGMDVRAAVKECYPNASEEEISKHVRKVSEKLGYDGQDDQSDGKNVEEVEDVDNEKDAGLNVFQTIQKEAQESESEKDKGDKSDSGSNNKDDSSSSDDDSDSSDNGDNGSDGENGGDGEDENDKESNVNLFDMIYKDAEQGIDVMIEEEKKDKKEKEEGKDKEKNKNKDKDKEDEEEKEAYTEKDAALEAVSLVAERRGLV